MRWFLTSARLLVLAVYLVITFLILMVFIPPAMLVMDGAPPDDLISVGEPESEMIGDIVHMSVPLTITNPTYYDIEDLTLSFEIRDGSGEYITGSSTEPVNVIAGEENELDIEMSLDLSDIDITELDEIVFEGTILEITVGLHAGYMLGLVWLDVTVPFEQEMDPLVNDYGADAEGATLDQENRTFDIPYYIDTNDMLDGHDALVGMRLSNSTGIMGSGDASMELGGYHEGECALMLSNESIESLMTTEQDLTLEMDVSIEGASVTLIQHYHWAPPSDGEGVP